MPPQTYKVGSEAKLPLAQRDDTLYSNIYCRNATIELGSFATRSGLKGIQLDIKTFTSKRFTF